MQQPIECKSFEQLSLRELYEILLLRSVVFVVEQDCPYQDVERTDYEAQHFFIKQGDEVLAYLRTYIKDGVHMIGRVVVHPDHRAKGYARQLMIAAIQYIRDLLSGKIIRLSGQTYLMDFYQSLDFKIISEEYLEDGLPHHAMELQL